MSKQKYSFVVLVDVTVDKLKEYLIAGYKIYGNVETSSAGNVRCKLLDLNVMNYYSSYTSSEYISMHLQEYPGSRIIVRHKIDDIKWFVKCLID